jgi:apoptosis-inducing factor 2
VLDTAVHPGQHAIIKAKLSSPREDHLVLDREWQGSKTVPFNYLVIATGTRLRAPANIDYDEKHDTARFLRVYQTRVQKAQSIVIIGGGAVGVQLATDLKELFSDKITLAHSRKQLMPAYHEGLHNIIIQRLSELGIKLADFRML